MGEGVHFADLISFLLIILCPVKMKQFGFTRDQIILFHSVFKSGGGGVFKRDTLDPPLNTTLVITHFMF